MFSLMQPNNQAWLLYAAGNTLLILPNVIWVYVANKISSAALEKPPSRLINAAVVLVPIAVFVSFALISSAMLFPDSLFLDSINVKLLDGIVSAAMIAMFVALITSIILVSRRIVDTQESPNAGRKSRIFVLCIGFFYIAIGMFFIAPKLKKIRSETAST